jgi:hypothetical protein
MWSVCFYDGKNLVSLEHQGVNERIILNWIFKKRVGGVE